MTNTFFSFCSNSARLAWFSFHSIHSIYPRGSWYNLPWFSFHAFITFITFWPRAAILSIIAWFTLSRKQG